MVWALGLGPDRLGDVAPAAHITLIAIANCADADGRNAWPSAQTLAEQRTLSVRTIRRHLEQLEDAGLLTRGNQLLVRHLPSNRRPVVWDLALHPVENVAQPVEKSGDSVDNSASWGDTNDTPEGLWGVTPRHSGVTPGVTQTVLEPVISSNHLTQERRRELSTGDRVDFPGRDCVHGQEALWYHDKRRSMRLPRCPYCRKSGTLLLAPVEEDHG